MNETSDYTAKKIYASITLDGNVKKAIWQNATWSKRFVDMVTGSPGMYNTQAAILWNDTHLYIAFEAEEPQVEAKLTERDSIIFLENDLEVFIDGGDCYYELEVNAANTIYEVFFIWKDAYSKGSKFDIPQFDVHQDQAYTFGGDYDRNNHIDKGWSLEIGIPWNSLKLLANGRSLPPTDGDVWKMFLGRFQKLEIGGKEVQPHPAMVLSSHGIYDTHLPEKWSKVKFIEK